MLSKDNNILRKTNTFAFKDANARFSKYVGRINCEFILQKVIEKIN